MSLATDAVFYGMVNATWICLAVAAVVQFRPGRPYNSHRWRTRWAIALMACALLGPLVGQWIAPHLEAARYADLKAVSRMFSVLFYGSLQSAVIWIVVYLAAVGIVGLVKRDYTVFSPQSQLLAAAAFYTLVTLTWVVVLFPH